MCYCTMIACGIVRRAGVNFVYFPYRVTGVYLMRHAYVYRDTSVFFYTHCSKAAILLPVCSWVQDYGVCIARRLHTAHSRRVTLCVLERFYMVAFIFTGW
jgi:hypothetical protein